MSEVNLYRESPSPKRGTQVPLNRISCLEEGTGPGGLCSRRGWQSRGSEEPAVEPADSRGAGPLPPRSPAPPSRRNQGPSSQGLLPRT